MVKLEFSAVQCNAPRVMSFQRQSSQPITLLILTNKTLQKNTRTKYNSKKSNNEKDNKATTLVQSLLTTLGREMR